MSNITNKLKHMIVEEDAEPRQVQIPVTSVVIHAPEYHSDSLLSGSVYLKLKTLTDFDSTEAGQILKKFLDPLANVEMDERTKFKVALAMAKSQEPLIEGKIKGSFNALSQSLENEQAKFAF